MAHWDIRGFDLSELRQHMKDFHPNVRRARANVDLAAQHTRQHTRYHTPSHSHMAGRITIKISGLPVQYDEGWITGKAVMTPQEIRERFLRPRSPGDPA